MDVKEILPRLYVIKLGPVNAYLVEDDEGRLAIVDTGYPKSAGAIEAAIRSIGRQPGDLTDILLTHAHPDHLGSAAHLSKTSASVSMHSDDATIAARGIIHQTMTPAPGVLNRILFKLVVGSKPAEFPAFDTDRHLADGTTLDVGDGIEVVHTPGHTSGHVSLLLKREGGVLFVGDAASNILGLGYSVGYDDLEAGKASLAILAGREFEVALFGHGRPIAEAASLRFADEFG